MRKRSRKVSWRAGLVAAGLCASSVHGVCEGAKRDLVATGQALRAEPADPRVSAAVKTIDSGAVRKDIEALVGFGNRSTLGSVASVGVGPQTPGKGVTAAADWVAAQYEAIGKSCGGCLEVKRDQFTEQPSDGQYGRRIHVPTPITNVYAVLKGTETGTTGGSRTVLVTGHYDSRNSTNENTTDAAPGANDDASGVAVSIECARALAGSGIRFPATIVFAAVAGEEQGLNGSHHLAELMKGQGVALEGVLNNDIVGGDTTPGDSLQDKGAVRVFSEGIPAAATPEEVKQIELLGYESDSASRELARAVAGVARSYGGPVQPLLEMRRDRFLRGGDHTSFNGAGFAAVRFTEWRENFDHQHQNVRVEGGKQYGDLLQYVDFGYVASVARLNAAALASLALAPAPPKDVKVVVANLDNGTTLRWAAVPGTEYQVVWRNLASADWEYGAAPAASGEATLPVSKDNVVFGVRAVDAAGHASLAVVPLPGK